MTPIQPKALGSDGLSVPPPPKGAAASSNDMEAGEEEFGDFDNEEEDEVSQGKEGNTVYAQTNLSVQKPLNYG